MVLTPPLHTHTQTPFISQFKKHRPKRQSALLPSINNNFLKEEEEIKKKKKKEVQVTQPSEGRTHLHRLG